MTRKNMGDLSDPKKVQEAGTRGYKGEPEPVDPPAKVPAPPPTIPAGQEDEAGMKSVEQKPVEDAGE